MPIFDLDSPSTPATGIVANASGVTLGDLADGINQFSTATASGGVGAINFSGKPRLRVTVTGSLTGAYTSPQQNIPTMADNSTSATLMIEYIQDATGGRAIPLATLFANYAQTGAPVANTTPDKPTVVLLEVMKDAAGALTYSASFPPEVAGEQITFGTIAAARLPVASTGAAGVIQIGTASTAAAAGNHTHLVADCREFVIDKPAAAVITAGDYPILRDVNFAGVVTLWTKVELQGGTTPTATLVLKINATTITGTQLSATATASGDGVATSGNRYALRQAINVGVTAPTGNFTRIVGTIHLVKDGAVSS